MISFVEFMANSLLCILVVAFTTHLVVPALAQLTVTLKVNATNPGRQIPSTLFGLFFEVRRTFDDHTSKSVLKTFFS